MGRPIGPPKPASSTSQLWKWLSPIRARFAALGLQWIKNVNANWLSSTHHCQSRISREMATMMYPSITKSQSMRAKRKSAVELLAESKPFYVKSEIVRDNTQQLPSRPHSNFGAYGTYNRSKSVNVTGTCSYSKTVNFPQCNKPGGWVVKWTGSYGGLF